MRIEDLERARKLAELRAARVKDRDLLRGQIYSLGVNTSGGGAVNFTTGEASRISAHLPEAMLNKVHHVLVEVLERWIAGYDRELEKLGVELEPEKAVPVLRAVADEPA